MTCISKHHTMATRVKMLKLLQEMRGFAEVTNRRRVSRHPALLMMPLRSHRGKDASNARRKHSIPINMQEPCDIPHPVKIVHLTPSAKP